jgi:hypothetical protein
MFDKSSNRVAISGHDTLQTQFACFAVFGKVGWPRSVVGWNGLAQQGQTRLWLLLGMV